MLCICVICQVEFEYIGPRGYVAQTCSKACRSIQIREKNKLRRLHEILVTNCEVCGTEVVSSVAFPRKNCSKECHAKFLSMKYRGRKITEEWRNNQNVSKTREKIIKYGDFECKKCGKKFETNTSLRSHSSYCTPELGPPVTCQLCGREFKNYRGLKLHEKSHNEEWSKALSEKIKKNITTRKPQQRNSKKEVAFFKKLSDFFGEHDVIHKFRIESVAHEFDFYIKSKNLIVEFDGDYWHGNPTLFDLTPRMKKQFRIDESWNKKAIEMGYNIIRIWDSESETLGMEKICSHP